MSNEAMAWVLREGMRDLPSKLVPILFVLADAADEWGEGARPWITDHKMPGEPLARPGLATLCGIRERGARDRLKELEALGVTCKGNQRLVEWVRADRRPTVWDIPGVRRARIARSSGLLR